MDYYSFYKFLQNYLRISQPPSFHQWPSEISLNTQIWDSIRDLYRFTTNDNYEYEITLYYADGDIIAGKPHRGGREYVHINHSMNMKYIPIPNQNAYEKQVIVDAKIVAKSRVEARNVPKSHELGALFNIHTHPLQQFENSRGYSFYSDTDINSLIKGGSFITGLVTNELWLAAQSSNSVHTVTEVFYQKLMHATQIYHQNGDMNGFIKNSLDFGIVFYRANFGNKLIRVN